MRFKLLSCEIFYREMCAVIARADHRVDVRFLSKGLHDLGAATMLPQIQETVDEVDSGQYDAVLLGYGLCGNGLVGLTARDLPLVIPRAHDCIALFLGSRQRYLNYFRRNPGVYFKTTGWIERGGDLTQLGSKSMPLGPGYTYEELRGRYGEDNAEYLFEELGNFIKNYSKIAFIEMGVESDDHFERESRREAEHRKLAFEKIPGDLCLLQQLVDGKWDKADFLVVPPGHRVIPTYDDDVIGSTPA